MYPELPSNHEDLVPLPRCDGPKLKPFPFGGPQQDIEFLEYMGAGMHGVVYKVRIMGSIYALKLFDFFVDENDGYKSIHGYATRVHGNEEGRKMRYEYSDPFNAECRAFGRLQETGHEHLALTAHGYILLNESNERLFTDAYKEAFKVHGTPEMRMIIFGRAPRFRLQYGNGRPAPIRCIVKEFGSPTWLVDTKTARKYMRDLVQLNQLGIIGIDPGEYQSYNGKHGDFSIAITSPHYAMTPGMNPDLTPEDKSLIWRNVWSIVDEDYKRMDGMVEDENDRRTESGKKNLIKCSMYPPEPNRMRYNLRSNLRNAPHRDSFFLHISPCEIDWQARLQSQRASRDGTPQRRYRLPKPRRVYRERLHFRPGTVREIFNGFEYKDGHFFPTHKKWIWHSDNQWRQYIE